MSRFQNMSKEDWELRDWFAGQAVTAYASVGPSSHHAPAMMVAKAAYELADALLAARTQEKG